MTIEVGDKAPDFRLPSTDGGEFELHEALKESPVLINFYVGDFGINCTNYMNRFIERFDMISDLGVKMVAVNDNNMDSHKLFKSRLGAPFEMLVDDGKAVAKEYGAIVGPGHMVTGFTNREFYLVDRDGTVRFVWRSPVPKVLPELEEIVEGIRKALD